MTSASVIKETAYQQAMTWLVKLNSPTLSPQEEADFFRWLEADTAHQLAYIKTEKLWQRGEVLAKSAPAPSHSVLSFLGNRPLLQASWLSAACVGLVLTLLWLLPLDNGPQTYETRLGEIRSFSLDDGSKLVLNTDSRVRVDFNRHSRKVTIERGEVYFEVKPQNRKPFDIAVSSGFVRVLGTRFSVQERADSHVVTVVEGRVALGERPVDSQTFVPMAVLSANQQLSFADAQQGIEPVLVSAEEALSWRQNRLIYRDASLAKVVEDINRYYGDKLVLGDPSLRDQKVFAIIRLDNFDAALLAITTSLDLQYQEQPSTGKLIIVKR